MRAARTGNGHNGTDPLWYKDAIIYELHVRAFQDSNADGIGDFPGLTQRLDYLQELGVTAIWLLPFYPSPLKDDGYDIADYYSINPIYGTLKDFKVFLNEAHARNLRVITELVVNHTSDRHPWFDRSRRAKPGSAWRDFYVWSDTADKYKEARIIFRDFEQSNWTWDPVARAYFWHRFYSHQPDLNYDSPLVRREIQRVLDFWLDMGVDGLRLDAVPYLYEREATSCENLKETHEYLKTLRKHVDDNYGDRMLLAEANQWPEDAVTYFGGGKGDECHMAFHFPLMPRIFMSVRMEDRVPIVDILEQTPPIPETSQWALFLRNHDELTLEMVTDEERDYMYRVYANESKARINLGIRRRLAPLLGNSRKRIELLHLLLLSYPGTPVLYYGDEIAMGDNIFLGDRNGVRTPMQWSSDKNAGFSRASPQALYLPIILDPEYHYEAVNVEAQQANLNSLWWWMKRLLALRKKYRAFGRGSIRFLQPENRKILAFVRQYENETILVVANLSRFPQPAQLDLAEFKQSVPVELFGRTEFPPIGEQPYFLTLSPHAAFWFTLEPVAESSLLPQRERAALVNGERWEGIFEREGHADLERVLLKHVRNQPWFCGRARRTKGVQIRERIVIPAGADQIYLLLVLIEYVEGDPEEYLLPLGFARDKEKDRVEQSLPQLVVSSVELRTLSGDTVHSRGTSETDDDAGNAKGAPSIDPAPDNGPSASREVKEIASVAVAEHSSAGSLPRHGFVDGILYDGVGNEKFCRALLETIARRRAIDGAQGELKGIPEGWLRVAAGSRLPEELKPAVGRADRRNTAILFGEKYFLKLFRRIEGGSNPDLEIRQFLSERDFPHMPKLAGSLNYQRRHEQFTFALVTQFVAQTKSGWEFTMDALGRYLDRTGAISHKSDGAPPATEPPPASVEGEPPEEVTKLIGTFLESARLLGQRTAQMHLALASDPDNPAFAPEAFTPFYQRSLYQSMRNLTVHTLQTLRRQSSRLPGEARALAEKVAARETDILKCFRAVHETKMSARRIRCHGDLHLGEVLHTGKDFIFVDFEGDACRPLGERRIKRSPLRDVASMIRSFDYVSHAGLFKQIELGILREDRLPELEPWRAFWHRWVSAAYARAYAEIMTKESDLLPRSKPELELLLKAHLLEKAIHEVAYELDNRPPWATIPLGAILQLIEGWQKA